MISFMVEWLQRYTARELNALPVNPLRLLAAQESHHASNIIW
jgi:hypothetical protein